MAVNYGKLHKTPAGWAMDGMPPHVCLRLKKMFASIPKGASQPFLLTGGDDLAEDIKWFLHRYPMDMSQEARSKLDEGSRRYRARNEEQERILLPDWKPTADFGFRDGRAPYDYQAQAAEIVAMNGDLLIMDDLGLGKSVSALAGIIRAGQLPAAIIVQTHLADQWRDDFVRKFTHLRCHVIKGTKPYDLPEADVYIFRYSNVAGWADVASQGMFKAVVMDEIQEVRHGASTGKGKAVKEFCDRAEIKIGLTATPIYNYGSEIFNVVENTRPGALGTWYEFVTEWCTGRDGKWIVKDPRALGSYLYDQKIALRRTEDHVFHELPPHKTIMHEVPYDEAIAAQSEQQARELALKVLRGSFIDSGQAARELDMLARHTTGVAKARAVAEYVKLVAKDEPVLLTGWHRDVYDIWLSEMREFNPVMYTGSETSRQKRLAKEAFIAGDTNIMIMSLRSGVGIDGLQHRCRRVIHGEMDWSPQVHRQVRGRLRRPGQTQEVIEEYLHTNGGSDPVIIEMLGLKASQSTGILDPFSGFTETDDGESRIKKLAREMLDD